MDVFAESHLEVKIFFDKEERRVLFAEADGEFVDILFSFLTLPLGAIVKPIAKTRSEPATIGCFSTLYQSVASLGNEHFLAEGLKGMLLHPRSSSEDHCRRLKISVAGEGQARYFLCAQNRECSNYMSIYRNTKCPDCRGSMHLMRQLDELSACHSKEGVFVSKASKFIITDDLEVIPLVPKTVISLLSKLGIDDMRAIEERTVNFGVNELLKLLKSTMLSTSPLTDVCLFECAGLLEVLKWAMLSLNPLKYLLFSGTKLPASSLLKKPSPQKNRCHNCLEINVKVVVKKSSKEFLFVEAGGDFIDFLFSLLLIPLGEMMHILGGKSCVGSLDGLYNSVLSLDSRYFTSENMRNILVRPKLPLLDRYNRLFSLESTTVSLAGRKMPVDIGFLGDQGSRGFVKEDATFFVLDNLVVTPVSPASTISILNKNKVSVSDLEERTVSIGAAEGISILRASLNSTSAISNGLLHNSLALKKPKQEK